MNKFAKSVKKALAVVAMAAAVVTVVPNVAGAAVTTTPNKECPANKANGYHIYQFYCRGFDRIETLTHTGTVREWFTSKKVDCTYKVVYDEGSEHCEMCNYYTGRWADHCDTAYHQQCDLGNIDYGICTGLGSKVTIITQ